MELGPFMLLRNLKHTMPFGRLRHWTNQRDAVR
jgi:hypothetical protein